MTHYASASDELTACRRLTELLKTTIRRKDVTCLDCLNRITPPMRSRIESVALGARLRGNTFTPMKGH